MPKKTSIVSKVKAGTARLTKRSVLGKSLQSQMKVRGSSIRKWAADQHRFNRVERKWKAKGN